jgi:Tfp pilus assembly protein PilE
VTGVPLPRLGVPRSGITRTGDTADGYRVMSARRLAHAHNPLSFLELGLLVAVLGVVVAVAVPEYLHMRQDANDDAAKTLISQSARKLEIHLARAGTFAGTSLPAGVRVQLTESSYCVETGAGSQTWHATRGAKASPGTCPSR